jgi:hypothetical protein
MHGTRPTATSPIRTNRRPNPVRAVLGSWLVFAALGCGGDLDASRSDSFAGIPGSDSASHGTEPITLRARDVERYLTVMREWRRLGFTGPQPEVLEEGSAIHLAAGWSPGPEAMRILRESDFEVAGFQRVTYSIMLAMAADDRTGSTDSLVIPGTITADAATRQRSARIVASLRNQPAGNVELVRRYRADIRALHR